MSTQPIELSASPAERGAEEAGRAVSSATGIPLVLGSAAAQSFLDTHDAYLFDCDGVLWHGGHTLPGAAAVIRGLREQGKELFFVTNNSSKSREEYRKKFETVGIEASASEIVSSSYCAAAYLREAHPGVKKVFVVGAAGLAREVEDAGFQVLRYGDERGSSLPHIRSEADFEAAGVDPEIGAVVCGWDLEFSYPKLCFASLCLQANPGCVFVATNLDATDRLGHRFIPGNGCQVAAIQAAASRAPIVVGKPSEWLAAHLRARARAQPHRICMVGDRLDTDIAFGATAGVRSALTMTGCTSASDAVAAHAAGGSGAALPTYVLPHVGVLLAALGTGVAP